MKLFIAIFLAVTAICFGSLKTLTPIKSGASAWQPSSLPGILIGVDPTCTITTSQWNDCWSGHSNHFVAGAVKPTTTTLGGKTCYSLTGAESLIATAGNIGISGNAAFTMSVVLKATQTALGAGFSGGGNTGVGGAAFGPYIQGSGLLGVYFAGGISINSTYTGTTNSKIITVSKSAGAVNTTVSIRVNGVDVTDSSGASGSTPNITNTPFSLNAWGNYPTNFWIGTICADFLSNQANSLSDIQSLESYENNLFSPTIY